MIDPQNEHDNFYFISFGVEEGGLLQFLSLPATADNVAVKKAVKEYRKGLMVDFKNKRKELREKLKANEVTQEEFDVQVGEWEREKDDKLAELNAMQEGYELKVAQQRDLANQGIVDDTVIWFEMFRPINSNPELLWPLLTKKRPLRRQPLDVSGVVFDPLDDASDPLEISKLPLVMMLDELFAEHESRRLIEILFDAYGVLDNVFSAGSPHISLKAAFATIIESTQQNIDQILFKEHQRLSEQSESEQLSALEIEKQLQVLANKLESEITKMTETLQEITDGDFVIEQNTGLATRFGVLRDLVATFPQTLLFLSALSKANHDSTTQRLDSFSFVSNDAGDEPKLGCFFDKVQQQHQLELAIADYYWRHVKHTNRNYWEAKILDWVAEPGDFGNLWESVPNATFASGRALNNGYSQYIEKLSNEALEDVPEVPIRREDMSESEWAQTRWDQEESSEREQKLSIQEIFELLKKAKAGSSDGQQTSSNE